MKDIIRFPSATLVATGTVGINPEQKREDFQILHSTGSVRNYSSSCLFIYYLISAWDYMAFTITKPNNMKNISELFSKEIKSIISDTDRFLIRSHLREKEFSIFDRMELKKAGKEFRFLILKIANISLLPVKHISRVVNTLYLLYGADDNGKGKFSEADIDELNNVEADWIGRSWMQAESNLLPAMIRCDDNEGLKLFVMNV